MLAPVNKIIDTSVVDGPGNRTAVFFQGCNFNCKYCHNPETLHMCTACGKCVEKCPVGALSLTQGKVVWNPAICKNCDTCIKVCSHQASPKISWMTVEALADRVIRNIPFIRGVTCSGGECTLQSEFIVHFFRRMKENDLNCLLDSNGSVISFEEEQSLMDVTDGVMLDIKAFDPEKHLALTGQKNELVLRNALYLASIGKLTEIRTVIAQNEIDNAKTVYEITKLLSPYLATTDIHYRIIAFRPFGVRKQFLELGTPSQKEMHSMEAIARSNGFDHITLT